MTDRSGSTGVAGVHNQVEMCDWNRMAASSHGIACNLGTGPKTLGRDKYSRSSSALCRGESVIGNDEALAIFTSTLQGKACCAAPISAQDHHPGQNRADRPRILPNGAERILCHRYCSREAYALSISDGINRADTLSSSISSINLEAAILCGVVKSPPTKFSSRMSRARFLVGEI